MKILKNDYFVFRDQKREHLARALEDTTGAVEAVLEKLCHVSQMRMTLTVPAHDVILNLGATPHPGKVYALDVGNLYYTKKLHDHFDNVFFFYKPNKQIVKDLWAAMDQVHAILAKRQLDFLLDDIMWEILPYHGEKFAGMFIKSKNPKIPDRIQIRPEIMPANMFAYVLLHEIGHNLHSNFATSKKLNAHWIRLFNTSIKVASVKKETSASLLEGLLSQEDLPSDFKSQLGEEEALAYKWIIRTISSTHSIGVKELDLLFEADLKDDIRNLWPVRTIPRKELAPIVSEYATKNFRELFAEVFAYMLTGKKLPDAIVRLMDKTLSFAKANRESK